MISPEKRSFSPANPDFAHHVRDSFDKQGLMTTFGARLATIEPGSVSIEVPFSSALSQQSGFFHGAVLGGVADSAGGYSALTLFPAGSEVVTVEYKINFLKPAVGEILKAHGRVLRAGRSITVCQVDIEAIASGRASACAIMQATFMRVEA